MFKTFKEYRESGTFLLEMGRCSSQHITGRDLHKYGCVPYYVNLTDSPLQNRELFSISCYYTSLLLQAVGKLYGPKYLDFCCRATHWPFFCVGYGNEVGPIEILKSANLLPKPDEVNGYVQKLEEARDYFVEDFMTLFDEHVWTPEPDAHRMLLQMVDLPILRKELDNEIGFFKQWLYNQTQDYGSHYMSGARYGIVGLRPNSFKECPSFSFPTNGELHVQCYVTLHSKLYQKQLDQLSPKIFDLKSVPNFGLSADTPVDLYKSFLEGKKVHIENNTIVFKTVRGFFADESSALQMLKKPVVDAKYCFRADRCTTDGKFICSVNPDSVSVEIVRGKNENLYDLAVVRFESELQIFSPLPFMSLGQLKNPFAFSANKTSSAVALRALLEYGNRVKVVHTGERGYTYCVMKSPESVEEIERAFFYETFWQKELTPRRIMELIAGVTNIHIPEDILVGQKVGQSRFEFSMLGHHCIWEKIVRDLRNMADAARKGIEALNNPNNHAKEFKKTMYPNCGTLSFSLEGNTNRAGLVRCLEQWIEVFQRTCDIIQNEIVPLENEPIPYGKRKRTLVARTLCRYLFRKIELDPLSFTEHKRFKNTALMLI